jgi:hypothetical protein
MLSVAPTVIIENGTDWPAIIASISAGVAAVAGISATLWQASRNWRHDDTQRKVAEKRQLYANFMGTFNACISAAMARENAKGLVQKADTAIEWNKANTNCNIARNELVLVAPVNIGNLSAKLLTTANHYTGRDKSQTEALASKILDLIQAMRADLGEPLLSGDVTMATFEIETASIVEERVPARTEKVLAKFRQFWRMAGEKAGH